MLGFSWILQLVKDAFGKELIYYPITRRYDLAFRYYFDPEETLRLDELKAAHSVNLFNILLDKKMPIKQTVQILKNLSTREETKESIEESARALRLRMNTVKAPTNAIDIVGTGGDGHKTFNISTATAIIIAACGVPVAKHGNRAVSSQSGASDILSALGVNMDCPPEKVETILRDTDLGFLMAPLYHPAMVNVAAARKAFDQRTIFNLMGPLTNPANVRHHLIGVYDKKYLQIFAEVLRDLGSVAAWIVHSDDGMDELTPTSVNHVAELKDGKINSFILDVSDFGLPPATLDELRGGDATVNAAALRAVFSGAQNAYRTAILMNAAAALLIAGKVADLKSGVTLASAVIDSGKATEKLDEFISATQS